MDMIHLSMIFHKGTLTKILLSKNVKIPEWGFTENPDMINLAFTRGWKLKMPFSKESMGKN